MSGADPPTEPQMVQLYSVTPTVSKSLDEIRAARGMTPSDPGLYALVNKLRSGKVNIVDEGLKELFATGDGALFDRLLEGATFESGRHTSKLLPIAFAHVLITILLDAPESSKLAPAVREAITDFRVQPEINGGQVDRDRLFSRLPNLTSLLVNRAHLVGTAPHPRLKFVTISDSVVDDLAGLASSPCVARLTLSNVKLAGGAELSSLDALEGAAALESLTVASKSLTDVRGLASALNLRCLTLAGCSNLSDISALEGHPSLRAIGLFGTAVDKDKVAKPLRAICSWLRSPNYDKMLKKPPQPPRGTPPPKKRVPSAAGKAALADLKTLLASSDREATDAWLAKIAAQSDPAVYDDLLEPVAYDPDKDRLVSRSFRGPLGTYAMLGLLAGAPAASPMASNLRAAIKDLKVTGAETDTGVACPIDLLHFEALPNLERLELRSVGPIVKRDRAPSLSPVSSLEFHAVAGLEDLAFIAGCPKLKTLNVSGNDDLSNLDALRGNATISTIYLYGLPALTSLKGAAQMPALHHLDIAYCEGLTSLGGLEDLPALEWLMLRACENLADLKGIQGLPKLERIELSTLPAVQSLEALRGHPQLDTVHIDRMDLASIEPLSGVPSLRDLYLSSPGPIATLAPLAGLKELRYLSVSRCPKLRSIDSLAALPLNILRLKKTGVTQVPEALESVWQRDDD